jgi:hypothetical protein
LEIFSWVLVLPGCFGDDPFKDPDDKRLFFDKMGFLGLGGSLGWTGNGISTKESTDVEIAGLG